MTSSAGAGLAVGIAFVALEQIVGQVFAGFGGTLATIGSYFPSGVVGAILSANELGAGVFGETSAEMLGPWTAKALIAVYFVVLSGGTIWVFNRRDITSGEGS